MRRRAIFACSDKNPAIFRPELLMSFPECVPAHAITAWLNILIERKEDITMSKSIDNGKSGRFELGIPSWLWPLLISMVWLIQLAAE